MLKIIKKYGYAENFVAAVSVCGVYGARVPPEPSRPLLHVALWI